MDPTWSCPGYAVGPSLTPSLPLLLCSEPQEDETYGLDHLGSLTLWLQARFIL